MDVVAAGGVQWWVMNIISCSRLKVSCGMQLHNKVVADLLLDKTLAKGVKTLGAAPVAMAWVAQAACYSSACRAELAELSALYHYPGSSVLHLVSQS